MIWEIASYSDKGTRLVNEDRISVKELNHKVCITLADGLGGQGGGSTAAAAVTMKMQELFEEMWGEEACRNREFLRGIRRRLKHSFFQVNDAVCTAQTPMCQLQATCVTLWLNREDKGPISAAWGHVGDSRLYFFYDNVQKLRTQDHSLVEMNRKIGIKDDQISRNVIWQAMGERTGIVPEIAEPIRLLGGKSVFLLCTDGLWECVESRDMEKALEGCRTPAQWLERLRELMAGAGQEEYDNNSAVAVFVQEAHGEQM